MTAKKICAMLLAVMLLLGSTSVALAAKREKVDADTLDFPAILEDTSTKARPMCITGGRRAARRTPLRAWWTGFKEVYPAVRAKSNAIPGRRGRRDGDEGQGAPAVRQKPGNLPGPSGPWKLSPISTPKCCSSSTPCGTMATCRSGAARPGGTLHQAS